MKTKYEYFFDDFVWLGSGKNSENKYNCKEKFLKNLSFGVDYKL